MEVKTIELSELGLSVRAFNAVRRLDIKDIQELFRRFRENPNKFAKECGEHHAREIAEALENYYLRNSGVMSSEPEPEQDDGYFVEDAPDGQEYIDVEPDKKARAIYLRDHVKAHLAAMLTNLYEVCKSMKEMRDGKLYKQLGYQNFEECCKAEFGLARRQTYKYISIAENLSSDFVHSSAQIGVNKLSLLAMLDEDDRAELMERTDPADNSVRELKAEIEKLKAEKEAANTDKQKALAALSRSQDDVTRAETKLMEAQKEADQLHEKNEELNEANEHLIWKLAETEQELADVRDAPVDHAVIEDTESKKELERVRGLMNQMSEGFSQKELEIEDRVRKEYELKLTAARNSGDGRQVYKVLIENSRQSVKQLRAFLRQNPIFATDQQKAFLDRFSETLFQMMEAMQDG
jgi:hypothetical protein